MSAFPIEDMSNACIEPVSYTHLDVYKRQVMASMMALSLTACGGNGSSATTAADTSAADTKAEGTTAAAPADKTGLTGSGKELIFTTGGDQGTYYGFGSVLAGQILSLIHI